MQAPILLVAMFYLFLSL